MEEKWWGLHLMDINGRWGLCVKEEIREEGLMKDVTPGKCVSKKEGRECGSDSRMEKCEEGRKRVHVKEPS